MHCEKIVQYKHKLFLGENSVVIDIEFGMWLVDSEIQIFKSSLYQYIDLITRINTFYQLENP